MALQAPIEKWMSSDPITVNKDEPILNVLRLMDKQKISSIVVMDQGKIAGIFSERDVVKHVALSGCPVLNEPIEEAMTKNPICVNFDEDYNSVYLKMYANNIRHVPVLKNEKLVGVVSIRDLLRFYQNNAEEELQDARGKLLEAQKMLQLSQNDQILELMERVKTLEEMSLTDHLTGLYNSRYFDKRLTEELGRAKRYGQYLSLIFCDIDFFKKINDTHGHKTGDAVLTALGHIFASEIGSAEMLSRLRKSDIVARYGGEEFVIILPQTTKDGGITTAERIRSVIERSTFSTEKGESMGNITLSFGVSEFPSDAQAVEDLIVKADSAMYAAKNSGRNSVVGWNESFEIRIHE
jgi:diguanylate cyclase (GGDEF)-like protein